MKEIYGDHGITAKEFCQSIEKQVGDPYEFMRLAGVNLNDPATFSKMINDGNDIKKYITNKEKELEQKSQQHTLIQKAIDLKLTQQLSDSTGIKPKPMKKGISTTFRMVDAEVEKILTKKPIQINGFGINEESRAALNEKQKHAKTVSQNNPKNM